MECLSFFETRVSTPRPSPLFILVKLRCQVHMELAKCEEAIEQVEAAVKHVNKALQLDDSG